MGKMLYEDATDSPDERVAYPEYVNGFVDLGFVQLGRVTSRSEDYSHEYLAKLVAGDRWQQALDHMKMPTPVLAPPTGLAFVEVDWLFDCPSVRLRTHLNSGYLVETLRRWDSPPWDRPDGDIDKLMLKDHAPNVDRSTRLVSSSEPATLWIKHLEHLDDVRQRRGGSPLAHEDLEAFIERTTETFDRDRRYSRAAAEQHPAGQNPRRPFLDRARLFPKEALQFQGALVVALAIFLIVVLVMLGQPA